MQLSPIKLSHFNIMLHQQLQESLEAHLVKNSRARASTSQVLDETFVLVLKSSQIKSQNVLVTQSPPLLIRHYFRHLNSFIAFPCRTEYFKNSFFVYSMNDQNKLNTKILNSSFILSFRNCLIKFTRPSKSKYFSIHNQAGIKLIARLLIVFSRYTSTNLVIMLKTL